MWSFVEPPFPQPQLCRDPHPLPQRPAAQVGPHGEPRRERFMALRMFMSSGTGWEPARTPDSFAILLP